MASSDFSPGFLLDFASSAYTLRYSGRATDQMRSLLFHHLLSQHPILPTPETLHDCFSRFFTASMPSPCVTGSALSCSPCGANMSVLQVSFYITGCCFALPFAGRYNASTQPVARLHWLPATWWPDPYQDWTFTSKQTMIYQDTPRNFRLPGRRRQW